MAIRVRIRSGNRALIEGMRGRDTNKASIRSASLVIKEHRHTGQVCLSNWEGDLVRVRKS